MKFLDRLSLTIFSIIILIISLVACTILSGWLELEVVIDLQKEILYSGARPVILVLSILFAIMSLKCIFFNSYSKEKTREGGILLENENGKLLVSKDTIENLTTAVIKNFDSVETSSTKVDVDSENKISIFITLSVYSEAIIKELTAKIQTDIKEAIKKSLDLEIKEVNIRIKNINNKKEEAVKE